VERQKWIIPDEAIAVSTQCKLLAITRSVVYAHKKRQQDTVDEDEGVLLQLLDEEYTRHPFYGTRRMTEYLRGLAYVINRKRVQRLMRILGLAGMAPGPNTSKRHPQHKLYPYLLRGIEVIAPNQVWSTYIRLRHGFVYLVAIIDWYSRKVLAWRLSNTMDAGFCVDCLEEAIKNYGSPYLSKVDISRPLSALPCLESNNQVLKTRTRLNQNDPNALLITSNPSHYVPLNPTKSRYQSFKSRFCLKYIQVLPYLSMPEIRM